MFFSILQVWLKKAHTFWAMIKSCKKNLVFPADLHSLLDVAKIADSLVFVLESTEGWDSYGEYCLSCLFAQGLPSHGKICLETISYTG